jgi:nucleoside-diphosphate-sugar epimerase
MIKDNKKKAKKLREKDSYGFRKLLVEQELLRWGQKNKETRILSLRLADVIGPWDDSCRFWKYILWAEIASVGNSEIQLNTAEHLHTKLSFTFSQDVVSVIMQSFDQ